MKTARTDHSVTAMTSELSSTSPKQRLSTARGGLRERPHGLLWGDWFLKVGPLDVLIGAYLEKKQASLSSFIFN